MDETAKWRMVAGFVALAVVAFLGVRAFGSSAGGQPVAPVRISGGSAPRSEGRAHKPRAQIYVHVAGEVRRPGLIRIPKGARVAVALYRAGGPTPRAEIAAINLAQRLSDGQQVLVPRAGAVPITSAPPAGGVGAAGGAEDAPVSLATATPEQLDGLDGIGPTLAERIIEFRDEKGGFRSVGQLQEVEGIGEKRFAALKEAVVP